MSGPATILVLGGYGGFGGRIALRLVASGHLVIVAGRHLAAAERFSAGRAGLTALRLDRNADLTAELAQIRPAVLIDASGPFQGADYAVPRACIAAGVHYVDIADARDFVTGIGELDAVARAAGVVVISGASSVPALSGAAVRLLSEGLEEVDAVELAISASNRATAGPSVTTAILGYVGRPIRLWRGHQWTRGWGWQEQRTQSFNVAGTPPITRRLVALAEVPDLDLLIDRVAGRPAVVFRAGTELKLQMILLGLLSWLVRWGLLSGLSRSARWLLPLQRVTAKLGSDRSAMVVSLFGRKAEQAVERRWTLIADAGHGPEIPALAAPLVVERLLAGTLAPGARDAGELLALEDFAPAFAKLTIFHEVSEIKPPPPLYARIMGERFGRLPAPLRLLHTPNRDAGASGRATVLGGDNSVARLFAKLIGFPIAGEHDLHVHFAIDAGVETWTRTFSGRSFRSRLCQRGTWLVERFGPLSFAFDLPSNERGLVMQMRAWWLGPVRLPISLAPRSPAREWAEGDRFCFDVPISVPLVGTIVHYRGWLETSAAVRLGCGSQLTK